MSFQSGSTLKRGEQASGASSSLVAGGVGGGGAAQPVVDGLATTIMGIPPADTLFIRYLPPQNITISEAVLDAKTPPGSDFGLILRRIDSGSRNIEEQATATLPSGDHRSSVSLSLELSDTEILEVLSDTKSGDYSEATETLSINLEVS